LMILSIASVSSASPFVDMQGIVELHFIEFQQRADGGVMPAGILSRLSPSLPCKPVISALRREAVSSLFRSCPLFLVLPAAD